MTNVNQLIEQHQLQRHPEGGWYRELYRSTEGVLRRDAIRRSALTAILFLLPKQEISCWHRVRHADEAWTHIGGDPLELFQCSIDGSTLELHLLSHSNPVHVVPADAWQAARPTGYYSLVSCCVGPGFEFDDFEMLRHQPPSDRPNLPHPELI